MVFAGRRISEEYVKDGKGGIRLVRQGNKVKLWPVSRDGDYFARRHFKQLRQRLQGEGPWIITGIWKYSWGVEISLKMSQRTGVEKAVSASDLMYYQEEIVPIATKKKISGPPRKFQETTFRGISGKRVRCNQTRKVMKAGQAEGYARKVQNSGGKHK